MTIKFSLLQLFSLVDGRMSTTIEDIVSMLNHICNAELMTHELPAALQALKTVNPSWLKEVEDKLLPTKGMSFADAIEYVTDNNEEYQIPQLTD